MSGEVGRLHVITDEVLQSRWTHAQLAGAGGGRWSGHDPVSREAGTHDARADRDGRGDDGGDGRCGIDAVD